MRFITQNRANKLHSLEIMNNYRASIISTYNNTCFLCGSHKHIEIHHIFSGCNRKKSTEYGLVVPLCEKCHKGTDGVHNNYEKMLYLRKIGQQMFTKYYPDLDFVSIFRKNYLD